MPNFKPSEVNLNRFFVDTFNAFEVENTVSVLVKYLSMSDDIWRTIDCREVANFFADLTNEPGPWRTRFNSPFANIDLHRSVKLGFLVWKGDGLVEFTDKAFERMEKWVGHSTPNTTTPVGDMIEGEERRS